MYLFVYLSVSFLKKFFICVCLCEWCVHTEAVVLLWHSRVYLCEWCVQNIITLSWRNSGVGSFLTRDLDHDVTGFLHAPPPHPTRLTLRVQALLSPFPRQGLGTQRPARVAVRFVGLQPPRAPPPHAAGVVGMAT